MLNLPPFSKSQEVCTDLEADKARAQMTTALPGDSWLMLHDPRMVQFLNNEYWAQDLEKFAPYLWVMSTHSSTNVNPLHRQLVKGRKIIVTEEPRLHLVWFHDRIFIKPLPKYLLSYRFWEMFMLNKPSCLGDRQDGIRRAALGYLRTYRYLIRHESDFTIAMQDHLRLIPQGVGWEEFCRFISALDHIKDLDVSGRYSYGELRLSRLNFYAPLFLNKFHFEQIHGQYGDYFARLYGPILFIFAVVSTMLNAMQVELAVDQVSAAHWVSLWPTFRGFTAVVLIGTILLFVCFVFLWLWMFVDEWIYTIRSRRQRRYGHQPLNC
ncbi:Uncharacterized protein BP5553_01683 [Venustampulla echinocandica]|uniref:Subtilisin-like serine protease n=1 Tax=Venustampulla echinocandica TaxID=2656787 RepID=A0A370U1Q3_9HELO|nr:Uncharacterized protein BP5553_01683 [Venustampulla echinocandica]RDL41704.1 Uncharacterized protein BP5553_01683 [Venustampulla echinocandica]